MAIYAVSDIHGCYREFLELLDEIGFSDDDELYVLGDVLDRGPEVDGCVAWLVSHEANAPGSNVRFLMGNHEEMADWAFVGKWSDFLFDQVSVGPWRQCGGDKTMEQLRDLPADVLDAFQRIVQKAPRGTTVRNARGELVLLSHAGIRPAEPESEEGEWLIQAEEDLMWIGTEWYAAAEQAPFHVVSGHTPTWLLAQKWQQEGIPGMTRQAAADGARNRVMSWERKHDIDCGCVFGGNLGALRLDDWKAFHVPSRNVQGKEVE